MNYAMRSSCAMHNVMKFNYYELFFRYSLSSIYKFTDWMNDENIWPIKWGWKWKKKEVKREQKRIDDDDFCLLSILHFPIQLIFFCFTDLSDPIKWYWAHE